MHKRDFLAAALAGAALPAAAQPQVNALSVRGPALLTVTGAITKPNRGPMDPALDQMMARQKLAFDKARSFDFAALAAMNAVAITPTLEYDNKPHQLRGPLLATVLRAAGAPHDARLVLRAVDGYAPSIGIAQARRLRFIVATHLDGKPMPLGGLGPLWAVFDADRHAQSQAKPVAERFAQCPWGLYHIDVQA
jgi:hypothetical protein